MARLGERIFDKGAKRLFSLRDGQVGLSDQLQAERRQHGLELGQFALVVRCENDFHDEIGLLRLPGLRKQLLI